MKIVKELALNCQKCKFPFSNESALHASQKQGISYLLAPKLSGWVQVGADACDAWTGL